MSRVVIEAKDDSLPQDLFVGGANHKEPGLTDFEVTEWINRLESGKLDAIKCNEPRTRADGIGAIDLLGADWRGYARSVLPLAALGDIVLCVPRLFERSDVDLPRSTAGGSLFLVPKGVSDDDLESMFLITRQFCARVWALQDHVQHAADIEARASYAEMLGGIKHSLGNALTRGIPSSASPLDVQRYLMIEQYAISAVSSLLGNPDEHSLNWDHGGVRGESIGATIIAALGFKRFRVELDVAALIGKRIHPCLPTLLVELIRNAAKRVAYHESVSIAVRSTGDPQGCTLQASTMVRPSDAAAILNKLRTDSPKKPRGIRWLVSLTREMSPNRKPELVWRFGDITLQTTEYSDSTRGWRVTMEKGLERRADRANGGLVEMELTASNLQVVRGESK